MNDRNLEQAAWRGFVVVLAVLFMGFVATAEEVIELREAAFVKGPKLYLGDVADIEGEDADALAMIEIGNAPRPGDTRDLHASLVTARLRNAGIELADFSIKGPAKVRTTTLHREITREEIAESLQQFIELEMPWAIQNATVDVQRPQAELTVPDGEVEFRWRASPNYTYLGAAAFQGEVVVDGVRERTVTVRANVEAYGDLVVAVRDIPRGSISGPSDVALRPHSLEHAPQLAIETEADVLGLVARKTIFPGSVLTARNVQPRILVKRRQLVNVQLAAGALNVTTQAEAMMDGRAGDTIILKNVRSEEQFRGVVQENGTIVVK